MKLKNLKLRKSNKTYDPIASNDAWAKKVMYDIQTPLVERVLQEALDNAK